jgi:hypothetical protein
MKSQIGETFRHDFWSFFEQKSNIYHTHTQKQKKTHHLFPLLSITIAQLALLFC